MSYERVSRAFPCRELLLFAEISPVKRFLGELRNIFHLKDLQSFLQSKHIVGLRIFG